ncbi:MAG: hypothetical protein HOP08_08510 [Cyclobacteriaceae bacterium]|nr:hypothetical protein [Cyclobacteriaceae bacterium]
MILIITHKSDFTADFVINKLNQLKIPYKRLNCEDILSYPYKFTFNKTFESSILGESQFHSTWFRRTKLPTLENIADTDRRYVLDEVDSFISNLYYLLDTKWLSSPTAIYAAENKLHQLRVAQEIGFQTPSTMVTSSKTDLMTFFNSHNRNVIVKSIGNTRIGIDRPEFIFTTRIPIEAIQRLDELDLTPCIFQENIEKEYEIRVTIVGTKVFAAAVDSQSDIITKQDWRRKQIPFRAEVLPQPIQELCIHLLSKLNLNFGAIDLVKTPEGKYVFLEINPNGQWVWIEDQTGLKISDAIISYLTD